MSEKIELSARDQRIADLANELAEIPIGWTDDLVEVDREAILGFQRKLTEFLAQFDDRHELIDAAVVISALLHSDPPPAGEGLPLPSLNGRISRRSFDLLSEKVHQAFKNKVALRDTEILGAFLEAERDLLLSVGLNQQTVQIILSRLEARGSTIIRNLTSMKLVSRSKWERSIEAARSMARIERLTRKTRTQYIRTPVLARLKDRVVGLATIWGDCVTLFYDGNIDVAGFVSVIAGATVSTILPSEPR